MRRKWCKKCFQGEYSILMLMKFIPVEHEAINTKQALKKVIKLSRRLMSCSADIKRIHQDNGELSPFAPVMPQNHPVASLFYSINTASTLPFLALNLWLLLLAILSFLLPPSVMSSRWLK